MRSKRTSIPHDEGSVQSSQEGEVAELGGEVEAEGEEGAEVGKEHDGLEILTFQEEERRLAIFGPKTEMNTRGR